jgi:hypothetical protein
MAIKRLEDADLCSANRTVADSLIRWFENNKDDVIRGAWYPDVVIKYKVGLARRAPLYPQLFQDVPFLVDRLTFLRHSKFSEPHQPLRWACRRQYNPRRCPNYQALCGSI